MSTPPPLRTVCRSLGWLAVAVACFHTAYGLSARFPIGGLFLLGTAIGLLQLAHQPTIRRAFYFGLAAGFGCYAPQLAFFWGIFSTAAIVLWLILAFWIGLYTALVSSCLRRWGSHALWLAPILWTGLEYFRSELYHLKFSWLNAGYALPPGFDSAGMYASGFFLCLIGVGLLNLLRPTPPANRPSLGARSVGLCLLPIMLWTSLDGFALTNRKEESLHDHFLNRPLCLTGIQLEFPPARMLPKLLDQALARQPDTDLFVLSEYTCEGPVPPNVTDWCQLHHRYLIIGGEDVRTNGTYYNTAFVVGPNGQIIFRQAKSVPIPFFRDGLPAPQQTVWLSPWGRIGICICYDLSFTRVTDRLVAEGAQLLIVPTMDVMSWGQHQHQLHARVAPVRAAEYGLPIFRLASSGISQAVDTSGHVIAQTHCGGSDELLTARLLLPAHGTLPLDRWLAPLCVSLTGILLLLQIYLAQPLSHKKSPQNPKPAKPPK